MRELLITAKNALGQLIASIEQHHATTTCNSMPLFAEAQKHYGLLNQLQEAANERDYYANVVHRLRDAVNELDSARDFFQSYVPLKDHKGRSLAQDWSWGPAENAVLEGEKVLDALPKVNTVNVKQELVDALRAIIFQVRQGKVLERDACITQGVAALKLAQEGT